MKSSVALILSLVISLCSVCPSLANHPTSLCDDLYFAIHQPKIAMEVLSQEKIWCDMCGQPYKTKKMKWAKYEGEEFLMCKDCRKHFSK